MLLFKNSFIKIRKSLGRFFSLIFIVALGSAFFAGVRETSSDMIRTTDAYYDTYALMDFRIVSTMGLTEDDVASLQELSNVDKVVPGYSFETVVNGDATKIYGYLEDINRVSLVEGRYLENENEILVERGTYNIGDTITLEADALDFVKGTTYTVVGIVDSPMYIYENKGISTVSDGKLDTFMYILPSNFTLEYYTEVYLTAKDSVSKTAYEEDYKETISYLNDELVELKPIRETARYEEILAEAMQEIYDAEAELNQQKAENDQKFADAKKELDDSRNTLDQGWADYNSGKSTLENTRVSMESTFAKKKEELDAGEAELTSSLSAYGITLDQVAGMINTLNTQIDTLSATLETLDPESEEYITCQTQLSTLQVSLQNLQKIETAQATIASGRSELARGEEAWRTQYNSSLASLNAAYQELLGGEAELEAGQASYDANYATYVAEISKAEQEIADAREEVSHLEKPVWYLFDREDNPGYTTFIDSATKVDSIAAVFPIFFILVAFLMGMNTMTRMIEEERGEIGLFISLGYSKAKIIVSYLFYVFLATTIGLVLGLTIGYLIVPLVIYRVYVSMFVLPDLQLSFNVGMSAIIALVCFGAMSLVTYITANRNFKYMPANLLRPEAPKMGKKVFLEHIHFLWRRLNFTWKVTIRNLFRYKKRIVMTLIGISGCTALLLTGFGIQNSIGSLRDKQFGEIEAYDAIFFLEEATSEINPLVEETLHEVQAYDFLNMESFTFNANNKNIDIYLMAFQDVSTVDQFIHLKDEQGNTLSIDDNGVILSSKTADMLGVNVGDTFGVRNSENELFILRVSAISENYVNHYAYMSDRYYEQIFGEKSYNAVITVMDEAKVSEIGNQFIQSGYFSSVQYITDSVNMFQDIIRSMNDIVLLILGFSTFLAITVLYNLTTINISERTREIATLKVLGFHDREVSGYVYRETLVLTIFGILIGMGLGVLLNQFVMTVAETDEILFVKDIYGMSYVYTFLIMTLFTVVVQFITYFILKKINMIDSLKSVE